MCYIFTHTSSGSNQIVQRPDCDLIITNISAGFTPGSSDPILIFFCKAAHFNDAFTRANHYIRGANELMALLLSPPP